MKTYLTLLLLAFCPSLLQAQLLESLPDSLKKGASCIILSEKHTFTVRNPTDAIYNVNAKKLIVNSRGSYAKRVYIPEDDFSEVLSAEVRIVDLSGREIKSYKLKDFEETSYSSVSIATDNRTFVLDVPYDLYPFVLTYHYRVQQRSSLHYPVWIPLQEDESVVFSTFTINSSPANPIRYKSWHLPPPSGTNGNYQWEIKHKKALQAPPMRTKSEPHLPMVYTAPTRFEIDGYAGKMDSWDAIGKWQTQLLNARNTLDETQVAEVKNLIEGASTEEEKVRIVYDYLQENTRYVSIQLGIGGWQPFESGFVHEKKYGDCKALSFYTKALLEEVGVDAFYTIIRAGGTSRDVPADFPNAYFNHVILTVPTESDTLFLECTSQTNPFGYLGKFTSDRNALLITEEGGKLIRTRSYSSEENQQRTKVTLTLNADGTATGKAKRSYQGLEVENNGFRWQMAETTKEQENWFYDHLDWGDLAIQDFEIQPLSDEVVPEAGFTMDFQVRDAGSTYAKRIFLQPFQFISSGYFDVEQKSTDQAFEVRYPYTEMDSITIKFPEGFYPEAQIKPQAI
ncbi:MAG: DUF3857 domain-containing protein, partial [Bacteroidota bacterium]